MTDYSTWQKKKEAVSVLQLDPRNPRLPNSPRTRTQRQILAELIEHEKVEELAQDIAERGYVPVELLIGVKEKSKRVIVEGNRRLAALKLLHSPASAPESKVAKFRSLAKKFATAQAKKVEVLYAPTRSDANGIILHKHTREYIRSWDRLMQARFYRSLLDSGMSTEDISKAHGIKKSEIAKFLRLDGMYTAAQNIELAPETAIIVRNPRAFPSTVLERFVDNSKFRNAIGAKFDSVGRLKSKLDATAYEKILSDIASKTVNTRTHNTTDEINKYAASLSRSGQPPGGKRTDKSGAGAANAKDNDKGKKTRANKRNTRGNSLIPSKVKCTVSSTRVSEVFKELKKLGRNIDTYPNSNAVMLRILLELAVYHHMKESGHLAKLLKAERAKNAEKNRRAKKRGKKVAKTGVNKFSSKTWSPTLKQMLNYMIQEGVLSEENPQAHKKVQSLLSQKDTALSADTLDAWVHGQYEAPEKRTLQSMWDALSEVFEIVLAEPSAEG